MRVIFAWNEIPTCIQVTGSPRFSLTGITPVLTTSNVIEAAGTVERSIIRNLEDIRLTDSRCVAEDRGMASTDNICNKMSRGWGSEPRRLSNLGRTYKMYLVTHEDSKLCYCSTFTEPMKFLQRCASDRALGCVVFFSWVPRTCLGSNSYSTSHQAGGIS